MRCWFHDWTRWTEPYMKETQHGRYLYASFQKRTCMRCKKTEERMI